MRLKSFTAQNMKDAMQMVRDTLGEEAIIVATREDSASGGVHVTAAIESDRLAMFQNETGAQPAADQDWLYEDDESDLTVIEEITDAMLRHGVPEEVLDQIVSCAMVSAMDEPRAALLNALETLFHFKPLPVEPLSRPLMVVGAPGAGKTLACAKLAARSVMAGLSVAVITTDIVRAGGVEQLAAFTRLMDIDLKEASSPDMLQDVLEEVHGADQIIIDTAGTNPFDMNALKPLARLIGVHEITPILVMPAGTDAEEAGDISKVFASIGARHLLPTRVDVTRRLGGLLSAAHYGGLSFGDMSNTAKVADGLTALTPACLTRFLMPRAEDANIKKLHKVV